MDAREKCGLERSSRSICLSSASKKHWMPYNLIDHDPTRALDPVQTKAYPSGVRAYTVICIFQLAI